ncbi:MAG TPA: CBS domain-containing protein, partial [Desulfobacteraceae bacterium]|nr:CBS domain-containing protein [Desulfobacteraceae bacterium]
MPDRNLDFGNAPPRFKGKVITDAMAGNITRVEELAYILKIKDVMTSELKTVTANHTMRHVMDTLREYRISGVPVVEGNTKLVGLVSTEDLIRCLVNQDIDKIVAEYMTTDLVTVNSFDYLTEALKLFAKTKLGRLPVLG